MQSGNLNETMSNLKNKVDNNLYIKSIKNSAFIDRLNIEKKNIIGNWRKTLPIATAIFLLFFYFYYIFRRVPRFLNRLKCYMSITNISSLASCKEITNKKNNYRLCDFFIASSYKSYLPCTNYYDFASSQAIKAVLSYGARYIDLDIFNKNFNQCTEPIVCNGTELGNWHWTTTISFEEVCETIANTAFSKLINNSSDPLFINLNLNINSNIDTANKIAKLLEKYFGKRLLSRKYSYQGINPNPDASVNIATVPITELFNKVIIICDKDYEDSKLEELVNISKKVQSNFRTLTYTEVKDSYDLEELTDFNRKNLTRVVIDKVYRKKNNFNYNIPWYMGSQFICMDYFHPDEHMKSYLKRFKNSSFVLKPYKLRYNPTYIKSPKKQDKRIAFDPQRFTSPTHSILH